MLPQLGNSEALAARSVGDITTTCTSLETQPFATTTAGYIKYNEGLCKTTMRDLSGKGYAIGYGHWCPTATGDCDPNNIVTDRQASVWLQSDIQAATEAAKALLGEAWSTIGSTRQTALVDMCYQMGGEGGEGCAEFTKMASALKSQDWATASYEVCTNATGTGLSDLAGQTVGRASRAAYALSSGTLVENAPQNCGEIRVAYQSGTPAAVQPAAPKIGTGTPAQKTETTTGATGAPATDVDSTRVRTGEPGQQIMVDLELSLAFTKPADKTGCPITGCTGMADECEKEEVGGTYNEKNYICTVDGITFRAVVMDDIRLFGTKYPDAWTGKWVQVIAGTSGEQILEHYAGFAFRILAGVIGVLATLMLAVGGIQIATAGANQEGVEQGKDRILGALAGMAILFLGSLVLYTINPTFFTLGQEDDDPTHTTTDLNACTVESITKDFDLAGGDIDTAAQIVAAGCSASNLHDLEIQLTDTTNTQ